MILQSAKDVSIGVKARLTSSSIISGKGPAIAVFKEMTQDESGPRIYWIVHGTNLLRCAPEHVRPDVSDEGCVLLENLNQAKDMLGNMKRTGVTPVS